jgi:hypothetical protein
MESIVDGPRYARALVACAATLTARARRAWVMRVFGDLPVAQIAGHPDVHTSLGGAHLMLNRARRLIRACMGRKGFETHRMPAGTFIALWDLIDVGRVQVATEPRRGPGAGLLPAVESEV